jgi:hypothetical protein
MHNMKCGCGMEVKIGDETCPRCGKLHVGEWSRVAVHMRMKYRVEMQDIEITDTPGYWRDKEPKMHPGHPLHGCIGCDGPFRATYTYFDPPRAHGRFASPTRSWAALRAAEVSTGSRK